MFLSKIDVQNLANKVAHKTYVLHKNNAKNVHMWCNNTVIWYSFIAIVTLLSIVLYCKSLQCIKS